MKLSEYVHKRDFSKTKEPRGRVRQSKTSHLYVIQKHAASLLHYDFRLELNGTLKSWAVPKGPSWDPSDKRLAVHVEDHPIDYGPFEGTIPQGEYGGGTVMLWDRGNWFPEGDVDESYKKGHLKFRIEGERLKGRWALVQMHGSSSGDGKNWLLIKEKDPKKEKPHTVDQFLTSVKTGRTMDQIAKGKSATWHSNVKLKQASTRTLKGRQKKKTIELPSQPVKPISSASTLPMSRKAPFPDSFKPQLAVLADHAPTGQQWIHELKYDGYRLLSFVHDGRIKLMTRNEQNWTNHFEPIAQSLKDLGIKNAILDGELVVQRPDGTTDFQALQNALKNNKKSKLAYYIFDLPYYDGYDLSETPLLERKKLLQQLIPLNRPGPVFYSKHIEGKGKEVFQNACHLSLEGIMSKNVDASYVQRRSPDWLKVKCTHRQEFVIGGYTPPKGSRAHFGSLLIGYHNRQGDLVYSGHVGTGFNQQLLASIFKELRKREQAKCPFQKMDRRWQHGAIWVKPELVGEVQFSEWTSDGILRHPSFEGLREDKSAKDVVIERAVKIEETSGDNPTSRTRVKIQEATSSDENNIAGVTLTHADKVLYPDMGLTKRDLCRYYEQVAELMLPQIKGRPISLVRCPQGQGQVCFYQKHFSEMIPDSIRTVRIKEKAGSGDYILIDDMKGLVSLAQLGVLEFHAWPTTEDHLEKPDILTFDLDPSPEVDWAKVVDAARLLKKLLTEAGLTSFLKTTGGKGLHIVAPVEPMLEWTEFRDFAGSVVNHMVALYPDEYIATMSKAQRTDKIFVDYFRNGRGATSVAPYSTRARAGAPVATPLSWNELSTRLKPSAFNVETVPKRLKKVGDVWSNFRKIRQRITPSTIKKFQKHHEGVLV